MTRKQKAAFCRDFYQAIDHMVNAARRWGWFAEDKRGAVLLGDLYIGRSRK